MTGQQSFEERFGFKARGQFRCTGWFEKPLTVLGLLLLLVGGVLITVLFANPYFALGGSFGALPFVLAAWFILCWWIVRIAHTGVTCRYEANDSEFRITDNRQHTEIFYYPDIMGVDYKPITYLTKRQRGYIVTIRTRYRSVEYRCIASGNQRIISPEDTPFFLLEQHCGLVRNILPEEGASRTID